MSNRTNFQKYKDDLEKLINKGGQLQNSMYYECLPEQFEKKAISDYGNKKAKELIKDLVNFYSEYQKWYSEALVVIRQLLPDRLNDFKKLFSKPEKRREITYENYVIEDFLQGLTVTRGWEKEIVVDKKAVIPKFQQQLHILQSVLGRFESSLFDIVQLVQSDLFDSEIEAAHNLNNKGFARGAGAMAGVILEAHLELVCKNHNITVKKKNPHISDYNELLKESKVIEVADWRFIQFLADIRNKCDHKKEADPTKEEVKELITGVGKVIKTIF